MTKVITRLCADAKTAEALRNRLLRARLPAKAVLVIDGSGGTGATADNLVSMGVDPETATLYSQRIAEGCAVIMARATYKPLGAPRIARETLSAGDTLDMGDAVEETVVPDEPQPQGMSSAVLTDHPLFLTAPLTEGPRRGPVSEGLGIKLLSSRRPSPNAVISGGRLMTSFMPMLSRKKTANSAIPGGRHVSKAFWPMPLVTRKEGGRSVIPGGGLIFSGLPTIIRR